MGRIALPDHNRPKELGLIAVLAITLLSAIAASLITSFVHKLVNSQATNFQNATVFREPVRRFVWLSSPIAGSYGFLKSPSPSWISCRRLRTMNRN